MIPEYIGLSGSYNVAASLMLTLLGSVLGVGVLKLNKARREDKDLSHWLLSKKHLLFLRIFQVKGGSAAVIAIVMFALYVLFDLVSESLEQLRYGCCVGLVFSSEYFSIDIVVWCVSSGIIIGCLVGHKGMALPIGNGFSVSLDRGTSLAFHINSEEPDIAALYTLIVPMVVKLRGQGIHSALVFKSWFLVARAPDHNPDVKRIRTIFKYVQGIARQRKKYGGLVSIVILFSALTVFLIFLPFIFGYLKFKLNKLPKVGVRKLALKLIKDLENLERMTGDRVGVISPMPLSLLGFVGMGLSLPNIGAGFSGLDGGFRLDMDDRLK
jgi:hypothetical protein